MTKAAANVIIRFDVDSANIETAEDTIRTDGTVQSMVMHSTGGRTVRVFYRVSSAGSAFNAKGDYLVDVWQNEGTVSRAALSVGASEQVESTYAEWLTFSARVTLRNA